jgi:hypothetical protein
MRLSFKTLLAAALFLGGAAAIQPNPASAQPRWDRPSINRSAIRPPAYRVRSPVYRGRAYYGPRFYRGARYYGPRYYRGYRGYYRPAYYGRRYYGGYPYRYYRRGNRGGAVVAGLIGGLALGTIASAAANPYYYSPAYYPYYRPAYFGPRCVLERRRVVNRYGRLVWRRIEVCY